MQRLLSVGLIGLLAAGCAGDGGTGSEPATGPPTTGSTSTAPAESERSPADPQAPVAELATGLNEAGFELWRGRPSDENLVFSPSSIGHALLMARAAAGEETGAAIDDAFGLPAGAAAHEAWNTVDQAIAATAGGEDELTVRIADRIWPRADVEPDEEWVRLLESLHGTTVETLDFAGESEQSREHINVWVAEQTEGLIPELLPVGFIDPQTVLVLTDALYFEARWETVFGKYEPVEDTFTRLDGTTVPVALMRQLELADPRGAGDGYVGAEIPYVGGDFSMLLVVPDEGRFEDVRSRLGQALLDEIDRGFTTGPYELLMPGWDDHTDLDILPWLTELGAAPGSYPAISPDAFLDGAVHGADIAVDEWGTVAAAATGLGFAESGPPEPELTVRADRPFLYLIRHRDSGLVLFAGQVVDPTA